MGLVLSFSSCDKEDDNTSTNTTTATTGTCTTTGTEEQSSNTEIEAMRQAMISFRSSLSSTLLSQASTCLENERFYLWHNTPNGNGTSRDGIIYGDLSSNQLTNFKSLVQLFLSTDGYQKVSDISELAEGYLNTLNANAWNPDYYSIDMFGDPESSGSWGFQLDGHHLAINFLVHGDKVSIVPAFFGGEPAVGSFDGSNYDVFEQERELALDLYNGLNTTENTAAVSSGSSTVEAGPSSNNGAVDPYRGNFDYSGFATGLKYSDMSTTTQANLILVMKEYVYTMTNTFADEWWLDIMDNIDDTYFVWIDDVASPNSTSPFYYRIYNPYLWVEFNAEDALGGGGPDYNHVHTITRIPNNPSTNDGGDYGVFALMINNNGPKTLFEHYAQADHHKLKMYPFDYTVKIEANSHSHSHNSHSHSHDG